MPDLQQAYLDAQSSYPSPVEISMSETTTAYFEFVDAAAASNDPCRRGQLVLQETRVHKYAVDDIEVGKYPRNHWGFIIDRPARRERCSGCGHMVAWNENDTTDHSMDCEYR